MPVEDYLESWIFSACTNVVNECEPVANHMATGNPDILAIYNAAKADLLILARKQVSLRMQISYRVIWMTAKLWMHTWISWIKSVLSMVIYQTLHLSICILTRKSTRTNATRPSLNLLRRSPWQIKNCEKLWFPETLLTRCTWSVDSLVERFK